MSERKSINSYGMGGVEDFRRVLEWEMIIRICCMKNMFSIPEK